MKNGIKGYILGFVTSLFLMGSTVFAEQAFKNIEVLFNSISIVVNGQKVDKENLLYNGTTYVPLRSVAEILGAVVNYDDKTRTAFIDQKEIKTQVDTKLQSDIQSSKKTEVYMTPFYKEKKYSLFNGSIRWGYIDNNGKIIIEPQFTMAFTFSEGLAYVMTESGTGFIDETGNMVIKFDKQVPVPLPFSEGLTAIREDKKWGYINKKGEFVITPKFDEAWIFSEGLARVKENGKWGYIDKNGDYVIEPKFDVCYDYKDNLALTIHNGVGRFIDKTGKVVIEPKSDSVSSFSEGFACFRTNNKYGFYNKNGDIVIKPQFDLADSFSEGLACVWFDNKVGFIDITGSLVIPAGFDSAYRFNNGLAYVKVNGKWGVISKNGNFVIEPQFDEIQSIVPIDRPFSPIFPAYHTRAIKGENVYYINDKGQILEL